MGPFYKRGLGATCLLDALATALPASAFVGNLRVASRLTANWRCPA